MYALIFLFFTLRVCGSEIPSYEFPHPKTPEELKEYYADPTTGGVLNFLGTSSGGRYLVEKIPLNETSSFFAIYKDKNGRLWPSLLDPINKREMPFVYVKVPGTDSDNMSCHPEEVEQSPFVNPKEVQYPPKEEIAELDDHYSIFGFFFSEDKQKNNQAQQYDRNQISGLDYKQDESLSLDQSNDNQGDDDYITTEKTEYNLWKDLLMATGVAGTIILVHYYLTYHIESCARYLACVERWSLWKSHEPIESLLLIKPEYLGKDLIRDIKTTYYQEPNPVGLFLEDLEEEYETILQWIQFRNRISFLGLLGPEFYCMEQRLALLDNMRQAVHHWRAGEMEKALAVST